MNDTHRDVEIIDAVKPEDLRLVREHALKLLKQIEEANQQVDAKAQWIFTIATAAVGGLLAYSSRLGLDQFWALPSLLAFLFAAAMAIACREPRTVLTSLQPWEAMRQVRNGAAHFEYWVAASAHTAIAANTLMNSWKARMYNYAVRGVLAFARAEWSRLCPERPFPNVDIDQFSLLRHFLRGCAAWVFVPMEDEGEDDADDSQCECGRTASQCAFAMDEADEHQDRCVVVFS